MDFSVTSWRKTMNKEIKANKYIIANGDRCSEGNREIRKQFLQVGWSEKTSKVVHTSSVTSDSLPPHRLWPTKLLCPLYFPGKNTGVGYHALLRWIFPTQGSVEPECPVSPALQVDSVPTYYSLPPPEPSGKHSEEVIVYITTETLKCLIWAKGGEEMGERREIGNGKQRKG